MNLRLMKTIDRFIGRTFARLLPIPAVPAIQPLPQAILLIRPGGTGDAVLLAPAIIRLKKNYPDVIITVLAEHRNAGVFALVPAVDQVYCYDSPSEFMHVLRGCYDMVIDTEQWHRLSAVVARLIRGPVKIGFGSNERRRMFTHTVTYSHDDYEADSFNRLLSPLRITSSRYTVPFLKVSDEARATATSLLAPLDGRPFVVLFPGASITERRWGVERFHQVAETLSGQGYSIVVVGGQDEYQDGEVIIRAGGLNLAGHTSLAETAGILEQSQLLISGDSGVLHIAVGLDLPTVSLFGPGIAAKWAPRGVRDIVINHRLDCSPCTRFGTTPPCPYGARCMREITVDEVIEAALSILEQGNNNSKG